MTDTRTDRLEGLPDLAEAACRHHDPDLWFPEPGAATVATAKLICSGCPIVDDCRMWAVGHPREATHGIWGGLTEAQRDRVRKAQRRVGTAGRIR